MSVNRTVSGVKGDSAKPRSNNDPNSSKSNRNSAGRWTNVEHNRFTEALRIYGKNWKKVEDHVGTRTGAQVRSHAQKFFLKVQKKLNVEKGQVIQNLDKADLDDKLLLSPEIKDEDDSLILKKRNYDEMMSHSHGHPIDDHIELDHKDL